MTMGWRVTMGRAETSPERPKGTEGSVPLVGIARPDGRGKVGCGAGTVKSRSSVFFRPVGLGCAGPRTRSRRAPAGVESLPIRFHGLYTHDPGVRLSRKSAFAPPLHRSGTNGRFPGSDPVFPGTGSGRRIGGIRPASPGIEPCPSKPPNRPLPSADPCGIRPDCAPIADPSRCCARAPVPSSVAAVPTATTDFRVILRCRGTPVPDMSPTSARGIRIAPMSIRSPRSAPRGPRSYPSPFFPIDPNDCRSAAHPGGPRSTAAVSLCRAHPRLERSLER